MLCYLILIGSSLCVLSQRLLAQDTPSPASNEASDTKAITTKLDQVSQDIDGLRRSMASSQSIRNMRSEINSLQQDQRSTINKIDTLNTAVQQSQREMQDSIDSIRNDVQQVRLQPERAALILLGSTVGGFVVFRTIEEVLKRIPVIRNQEGQRVSLRKYFEDQRNQGIVKAVLQHLPETSPAYVSISRQEEQLVEIKNGLANLSQLSNQFREGNLLFNTNHQATQKQIQDVKNHIDTLNKTLIDLNTKVNFLHDDCSLLIQAYNNRPLLFKNHFKPIEVSEVQLTKSHSVALKPTTDGIFWAIADENEPKTAWLVPVINLRVNEHNYKAIEKLFYCHGYDMNETQSFKLIRPVKLRIAQSREDYELENLGEISFY
jgi:DNA repair exonuclease SbcCD ATPase subunit